MSSCTQPAEPNWRPISPAADTRIHLAGARRRSAAEHAGASAAMDLLGGLANLKVDNVLSAVDKYVPGAKNNIKNLADKAKAYVNNVTELEMKVLEATNHEPWGPHGSAMQGEQLGARQGTA